MNEIDVINNFYGELTPVATLAGEIEAIDFIPHPLEDSGGSIIVDSEGNNITDWTPGARLDSFSCDLVPLVKITGLVRSA